MYYFLLCVAAVLYAVAFYCNRNAERNCNDGISTTVVFSGVVWLETLAVLCAVIIITGGSFGFSWFSLACAAVHAAAMVIFTFLNFKALGVVDLAKYSMFTMLGGMIVPFFYGILFNGEQLTVWKVVCCVLVTAALIIDSRSGKLTKRALWYLIGVFFVNGSFGVITTFHQNSEKAGFVREFMFGSGFCGGVKANSAVGSMQYMAIQAVIISLCAGVYLTAMYIAKGKIGAVKNRKAYGHMLLYGLFNSTAELILLFAVKKVDASVQYPIITGGVIVCSTVISMLVGENKNKMSLIPVAVAFAGLLCLVF